MARFTVDEVNAWFESTKLVLDDLDDDLVAEIESQTMQRIASVYDISAWEDDETTPKLIRTIMAMQYAGWYYLKVYGDEESSNSYGNRLLGIAESNINAILSGSVIPEGVDPAIAEQVGKPAFFPNDASSSRPASAEFPSDGPPSFTMGQVF